MRKNNKRALYESIMRSVSKLVKRSLNEDYLDDNDVLPDEWNALDIFNGIIQDTRLALILYKFYNDRGPDAHDYDNMQPIYIDLANSINDILGINLDPLHILNFLDNEFDLEKMLEGYIKGVL